MTVRERNKILNIITNVCKACPLNVSCPEEHCALFRIEKCAESMVDKNAKIVHRNENK